MVSYSKKSKWVITPETKQILNAALDDGFSVSRQTGYSPFITFMNGDVIVDIPIGTENGALSFNTATYFDPNDLKDAPDVLKFFGTHFGEDKVKSYRTLSLLIPFDVILSDDDRPIALVPFLQTSPRNRLDNLNIVHGNNLYITQWYHFHTNAWAKGNAKENLPELVYAFCIESYIKDPDKDIVVRRLKTANYNCVRLKPATYANIRHTVNKSDTCGVSTFI